MPLVPDASTPARFTGTDNTPAGDTSASFTAPAGALLVACVSADTDNAVGTKPVIDLSDSGGLTWTRHVERTGDETTVGGYAAVFTARTTSAVARTITAVYNPSGTAHAGTARKSIKVYVFPGVDSSTPIDVITANNEGGDLNTTMTTTSLTPGANGILVVVTTDWNVRGTITSSDLTASGGPDHGEYLTAIDVASGFKTCTRGVAVTGSFTSGGAGPQFKWVQVIVREAASTVVRQIRPFPFKPGSPPASFSPFR